MIEHKLETPQSFHWKDTSLQQIIEDIKTLTNLNVVPDTQALHDAGVCLSMPMSLSVDNIKLKAALNLLLGQARLGYVIKDQVVQITTAENANKYCEVMEGQGGCSVVQMLPGQNGPSMIWIIREPASATAVPQLPPVMWEQAPTPVALGPLPPPYVTPHGNPFIQPYGAPVAVAPLPPPYFAPGEHSESFLSRSCRRIRTS